MSQYQLLKILIERAVSLSLALEDIAFNGREQKTLFKCIRPLHRLRLRHFYQCVGVREASGFHSDLCTHYQYLNKTGAQLVASLFDSLTLGFFGEKLRGLGQMQVGFGKISDPLFQQPQRLESIGES